MADSPMKYLDKALNTVRDLGLLPAETDSGNEPIVALLNQITTIDEERVVAIARTLSQASLFNEIVREQVQAVDISEERLRALYGLTGAEARVASLLARGYRLDEIAEMLGVAYETTRKHLKQIFGKTSTARQADLVRVVMTGPGGLSA